MSDNPLLEDWQLITSPDIPLWRKIGIATLIVPIHAVMYVILATFVLLVPAGLIVLLLRAL